MFERHLHHFMRYITPQTELVHDQIRIMLLLYTLISLVFFHLGRCDGPLQLLCNIEIYGRPTSSDGKEVAAAMPFTNADPRSWEQRVAYRKFGEPQFLYPKFSWVDRYGGYDMVQLPRIWRKGQ